MSQHHGEGKKKDLFHLSLAFVDGIVRQGSVDNLVGETMLKNFFFLRHSHSGIDNCDIDFFKFLHRQVGNFEILNQSERDQNLAVIL
jgi:hypothetical protein